MIEQLLFIVVSVCLFGAMFYQMIKKNETGYIVILVFQAVGIILNAVRIYFFSPIKHIAKNNYIYNCNYITINNLFFRV